MSCRILGCLQLKRTRRENISQKVGYRPERDGPGLASLVYNCCKCRRRRRRRRRRSLQECYYARVCADDEGVAVQTSAPKPMILLHRTHLRALGLTALLAISVCLATARSYHTTTSSRHRQLSVAVVFYGLSRSLSHTHVSIQNNILAQLDAHNITYKIYVHSVVFEGEYSDPRSGEHKVRLNNTEWQELLRPDVIIEKSHDDFVREHDDMFERVLAFGDPHHNNGRSTKNEIEALHSMKSAVLAAQNDKLTFDGMLILRPDLLYLDEISVTTLLWAIRRGYVVTPNWQRFGGENDRFAYGAWSPTQIVGTRFNDIEAYCNTTSAPWHAEHFLSWVISNAKASHCCVDQRAARVRGNGIVVTEEFEYGGNNCGMRSQRLRKFIRVLRTIVFSLMMIIMIVTPIRYGRVKSFMQSAHMKVFERFVAVR